MPSLKRDDVEASLRQKGFEEAPGDHRFFKLMVDGKYTGLFTKTSRGKKYKTLGDELVGRMARQVKLTKAEFCKLVDCSLSGDEYRALLEGRDEL